MTLRTAIAAGHNPVRDLAKREACGQAACEQARRPTDEAVPMLEQAQGALVRDERPAEAGA